MSSKAAFKAQLDENMDNKLPRQNTLESIQLGVLEEQAAQGSNDGEIFNNTGEGIQYRTLGWVSASVVFMKSTWIILSWGRVCKTLRHKIYWLCFLVQFALGVLGIPIAFHALGEWRQIFSQFTTHWYLLQVPSVAFYHLLAGLVSIIVGTFKLIAKVYFAKGALIQGVA